ncbi:sugar ABC transporter permease [Parablautia intestinalis]|jgi:putative aldouronate transport system permease protein|uniref:Sugar ABC transporter permease n=1 Tax=Parablautia intestinalis TaxID=2320100 RepID=A0A3A9AJK4_9FIRM|nr:ABC transporter permease subunit [Parablautia intestinalis]MCI8613610.1 sugar ABC transporter permease [Lachnospiraceae bacterium]RKI91557.1 sugar ABC transporter permease [Parablautia intestinalis]
MMGKGLQSTWRKFRKQWQLQIIALAGMTILFLFSYLPLFGIIIAFKNYSINMGFAGIFESEWVGLKWFREIFGFYRFGEILKNTLVLSILKLALSFPAPILLALLLSEMRCTWFKRLVQTVSYLPNFISWVLLYTIATAFLNTDTGIINEILVNLGLVNAPVPFLTSPDYFYGVSVFMAVWKNSGYWAIIFLAAIAGIDSQLYEAADIDGAGRLAKIWHITLPGIKASVITVLILSIGSLLGGGMGGSNFEQAYIFGNTFNNSASEILQTYSFKTGLSNGRFAYATAVDLIQSVISILLILISNWGAKKTTGEGIF